MAITKTPILDNSSFVLSDRQSDHLAEQLLKFSRDAVLDPPPSTYVQAIQSLSRMPAALMEKIANLRYGIDSDLGTLLVRNTPLDADIPRQPKPTRLWREKATSISEAMHIVGHAAIGSVPISYEVENSGDTVATLGPKADDEAKQVSSSSTTLLELHGENQAHPFPPDILIISNLQEDAESEVGTIIASNRLAMKYLSPSEIEIGRRPVFWIRYPLSFQGATYSKPRQVPMFYGSAEDTMLNFDAHAMYSTDAAGERLIETMKRVLRQIAVTVYLRRGDLLIIDNRIVAHGRFPFQPSYDHPRINQRSFGRFDLASVRHLRCVGSTILR